MRQVSSPVRWGAGRKGRQDLARSLPGFNVLAVLFLGEVSPAFLPSKQACWTHKFRHLGVDQQYPFVCCDTWEETEEGVEPQVTSSQIVVSINNVLSIR